MTVMYAYSFVQGGFTKEGHEVIQSILKCADTQKQDPSGYSEYFDSAGAAVIITRPRSASWLVLTMLTQVFGVRGEYGIRSSLHSYRLRNSTQKVW